ncbi:MAG: fibronectin type III domain-containing protein [Pyrinomonadaceae bacterium]
MKFQLATLLILLSLFAACGKRMPPLPPVEQVPQRVDIFGEQIGTQVVLNWRMPSRNAPDGSVLNIARVDVYRLAEPLSSPLTLTEEEFDTQSTLISTIPVSVKDFALKEMTFTDTLKFAGQAARLRYAVRFVNSSGQKAAYSNFYLIEPISAVAKRPNNLTAKLSQAEIRLAWNAPEENEDGTKPPNVLGYNVYRSSTGGENAMKLNAAPVTDTHFSDTLFEFEKSYEYFVRTVSLGNEAIPVVSLESNVLLIEPKDTFAPSPPNSITIAAAPNSISIFFASNIESDINNYKIYRSTERDSPVENWQLLTPNGIETTTYQDKKIEPGKTYYYYITATDKDGNVSMPSEVVSETAF